MNTSNVETPSTGTQAYRVVGVPREGSHGEQLLKTFQLAFEATAFANLVREGGKYVSVRVEPPANRPSSPNAAPRAEPLHTPPRRGVLYNLLYASSIFIGGIVSLVVGFLVTLLIGVEFEMATGVAIGFGIYAGISLSLAAVLMALVVKVHTFVFREPKTKSASAGLQAEPFRGQNHD